MKVVNVGRKYEIRDDSLKVADKLSPDVYSVRFSKDTGFFLEKHLEIEINDEKIYGVHEEKVQKVLNTFNDFKRSLGVILSGDKGIGKSLFAKLLSLRSQELGLPVVIVNEYIPGIASFLESIEQEAVYLFDEFDKTFYDDDRCSDSNQTEMLSMFDGLSTGKKLFVITCNYINRLNEYLVNRPGRFHYHFRFNYPTCEEIREYLEDNLEEKYWDDIKNVILFSKKVNLNFDCLRAISFEINHGTPFKEAIKDLNILNTDYGRYSISVKFINGNIYKSGETEIDIFRDKIVSVRLCSELGSVVGYVKFNPKDIIDEETSSELIVMPDNLTFKAVDEDFLEDQGEVLRTDDIEYMVITKKQDENIFYKV